MKKLETIQKEHRLNDVYATDEPGAGGACHLFMIVKAGSAKLNAETEDVTLRLDPNNMVETIAFQHGPRGVKGSQPGVLDCDLLEIVRDRLTDFQRGEYACEENRAALEHIEAALRFMNKRVEDRAKRGVLGTNNK